MKNKYISFLLLITMAGSVSCKKVLDVTPYTAFTDATVYSTPDRIELAVVGVYDAAQSGFYPEGLAARGYPFGAANIQQDDLRGEDVINMESFYQITYNNTYTSASPNCYNMWNNCYALINKANVVMAGVAGAVANKVITEAAGNAYLGECRFLRAMAMHQLLIDFALPYADGNGDSLGVIIRDFAIQDDASIEKAGAVGRSSVATCYAFVESDLAFAAANLPETRSSFVSNRATKAAAIALQMRVLLHEGKWAQVLTTGNSIVSGSGTSFSSPIGGWKLTASSDGPFADNASTESIFSVENTSTDNGSVSGGLQSMFGSNGTAIGARGLIGISPILWNLAQWDMTDLRRANITTNFTDNNPATAPSGKKPMYFTNKYRESGWGDDAPQIRYAEVLLMMAEAYARANNTVDITALNYLNAVRNRAVTTAEKQYTLGSFASAQAFIIAVLAERRIEFLGEGKRWSDIHRLALDPLYNNYRLSGNTSAVKGGIPAKVLASVISTTNFTTLYSGTTAYAAIVKGTLALDYGDYRFIWPVPATEVSTSNGVIKQNPFY